MLLQRAFCVYLLVLRIRGLLFIGTTIYYPRREYEVYALLWLSVALEPLRVGNTVVLCRLNNYSGSAYSNHEHRAALAYRFVIDVDTNNGICT